MQPTDILTSCRLINFKAIRDTGNLRLTPLTVLIGDNGSGKSSLVEGLWTLKVMAESGVEPAMQLWRGVDHACHKSAPALPEGHDPKRSSKTGGMAFGVAGRRNRERFAAVAELLPSPNRDAIAAVGEILKQGSTRAPAPGNRWERQELELKIIPRARLTERWQFLNLVPQHMMPPVPRKTMRGRVQLAEDGRNIAEYLEEIGRLSPPAFDGILEAIRFVVPYVSNVRAEPASVVEKTLYLSLTEPGLLQHKGLFGPARAVADSRLDDVHRHAAGAGADRRPSPPGTPGVAGGRGNREQPGSAHPWAGGG